MRNIALVGVGSAIGGMFRYATVAAAIALFGTSFPTGTLTVNVVGSILIGLTAGLARAPGRFWVSPEKRLLLGVGFCGGLTTFSFYSWQALQLSSASVTVSIAYVLLSPILALVGVWLGYSATTAFRRR